MNINYKIVHTILLFIPIALLVVVVCLYTTIKNENLSYIQIDSVSNTILGSFGKNYSVYKVTGQDCSINFDHSGKN